MTRKWMALGAGMLVAALAGQAGAQAADPKIAARIDKVLAKTPLIDGHNDVPWGIRQRVGALYVGQPDRAKAALAAWEKAHPQPPVTLAIVADHIEHVAKVCGVDCVGIGGDFDGIAETPAGLEGVDKYPDLFAELARRGWSDEDLGKLAGGNLLRAMREAEAAAKKLQATTQPSYATLQDLDGKR